MSQPLSSGLLGFGVMLWDFDGVLINSMPIRDNGFIRTLQNYPAGQVDELLRYHRVNGGLSRYHKFRYFFETIRGEQVTKQMIDELAAAFSSIMLEELIQPALLIEDSVSFVKTQRGKHHMHIVSGSDGNELRLICDGLHLAPFFKSIHGSPAVKKELIADVLTDNGYRKQDIVLIGDSVNDFDAATENGIAFFGYNNASLKGMGLGYIDSFKSLLLTS